ncbi:MAG: CbtA family protein [Chloroflexi bacterium]|nr:CbtA family protein [Chloroflexota bacterium]
MLAALVAGVVGALAAGLFHFFASEPVVDLAIALESAGHPGEAHEVVSREVQKGGLFVALLLYGLIWAALIASAVHLLRFGRARQVAVMAVAVGWATAIFPFLKYPANPPGVGDPESLLFRQATYLVCLGLALVGAAGAYALARRIGAVGSVGAYGALLVVAFLALPANPDHVGMDPGLLLTFRLLSLGGLLIFWSVFTVAFAWLFNRLKVGG